ncbi:MAG: prephenate dehydratase [Candidatus Bathyarchaeia archaeon]
MKNSKQLKIAFQGEIGAYSELAVYKHFGSNVEVKPCKLFSDVFRSVDVGEVNYGVVPVENSIEGSVNQVYDLFMEYDLKVCGEIILKIEHCLIANLNATMDSIKIVYSHPQALGQCISFLERSGYKPIPTYDTAGSVKLLKEQGVTDAAAIASERAAQIYGMKILKRNISDNPDNYTRFFVLSKSEAPPSGNDKTSIIFSVKHIPGALYKALEEFASREINLTKIESRPTKRKPWEYNFYLDFEGHWTEPRYKEALEGLRDKTVFIKILGSYPKANS